MWAETWDGGATWHYEGDKSALPAALVAAEAAAKAAVEAQDLAAFGTIAPGSDDAAAYSWACAVTIGWLIKFTNDHDCWEWPTWRVVRDIVKPETAELRCRYADLPSVRATGAVGEATTFASHTWGAKWGGLVSALADGGADRSRRVWVDIFAIRQWPGNAADLAFGGVVSRCKSFVVVCQAANLCEYNEQDRNARGAAYMSMDEMFARRIDLVPPEVRKLIAFLRVWCLVELFAAVEAKLVVVMKAGRWATPST